MLTAQNHHRPIRSFVRRAGRIQPQHKTALAQLWPQYVWSENNVSFATLNRDWLFGATSSNHPIHVEIGFGMGHNLLMNAKNNPNVHFIGIEPHCAGIARVLYYLDMWQLTNIRILQADAITVFEQVFNTQELSTVEIYFPDPWPKTRHHKRRLVQVPFIQCIWQKLSVGGQLRLATDWQNYAYQMRDVLQQVAGWTLLDAQIDFIARPDYRVTTKYEQRGQRLGHDIWDLQVTKALTIQ